MATLFLFQKNTYIHIIMANNFSEIKKGSLLLSEPFMEDPNFKRTVILITEHDKDGTLGLILNRPTIFTVNQMIGNFPHISAFMNYGGPIDPERLNFLHAYPDLISEGFEIIPNVYWNGNFEELKENVKAKKVLPQNILFFSGYAGWEYEQLKEEIKENSWIICNNYKDIFKANKYMWKEILHEMGGENKLIAEFPTHPSLN